MASNHSHNFQVVDDDIENPVPTSTRTLSATSNPPNEPSTSVINREDHELPRIAQTASTPVRLTSGGRFTGSSQQQLPEDGCALSNQHRLAYYARHNKLILNEANLIQNRRINVNHKLKKGLELMCEEKVCKYKLEEVHSSLPSSNKSTFIMTFSSDGQRVASTHGDHRIYICDLNTGKLLDTLEGHPKTPWCLAWHPSNRDILASGCLAGEVRVWDLRTRACESWTSENNTIITSLDFHPKERVLVIATSNDIHFWDWSESEPFAKTTTTHDKEKVKFVEFDSSGTKLITGISNLPRFVGYTSDSLQNRIIDSYLTHNSLEQLPTDNMTSVSEISGPILNQDAAPTMNNPNETINFNERSGNRINVTDNTITITSNDSNNINNTRNQQQQEQPQQTAGTNDNNNINENDINYRSTITLSRVAFLYRQLEELEDAMRHTSFTPFIAPIPGSSSSSIDSINTSTNSVTGSNSGNESVTSISTHQLHSGNQNDNNNIIENRNSNNNNDNNTDQSIGNNIDEQNSQQEITPPNIQSNSSQQAPSSSNRDTQSTASGRLPHTFEPFVVSFDESLENLQLRSLVVDGQTINPASVVEQYPIDSPHQMHYMMHFESINQVNQNFIRISKLMSSVRLYRQIVQQILSSNSGQGPYQPNQILTAQSASPRATRHASNLPIVFREHIPAPMESVGRGTRSNDPILAIQFRNSARNVPLATICKIDLLSARSLCIMRAQQLIEQVNFSNPRATNHHEHVLYTPFSQDQQQEPLINPIISPILNRLHQVIGMANHAILTTSTVHSHIASLRSLINKLLNALATMYQTESDGPRIRELILNIAHSLTGRSWNVPLGATLNDIRLDVIHTLCTVDLTLHLTRQVQLIQMQRLSAAIIIEESRRGLNRSSTNTTNTTSTTSDEPSVVASSSSANSEIAGPSSSSGTVDGRSDSSLSKRKGQIDEAESLKKRKIKASKLRANEVDIEMRQASNSSQQQQPTSQSVSTTNSPSNSNDRLVVWNSGHSSASLEQNLQRFLVATASSMTNSHILVRIYHRLQGSPTGNILEQQPIVDHRLGGGGSPQPPQESRRRALSHDNSSGAALPGALNLVGNNSGDGVRPATGGSSSPTNDARRGGGSGSGTGVNLIGGRGQVYPGSSNHPIDARQRHPHLHVYQTRGSGQHLWFNQWTIPLPVSNSNYRVQCWNFSVSAIPNIKDSQSNVVTQKCRIHNDASIDISSDGNIIACLVPREDGSCASYDLKIFSLRSIDFGTCYYQLPHGANAISVSLSPSAGYAVVGLANNKIISNDSSEDNLTIAKVFKLGNCKNSSGHVRDIKIKRDDSSLSLNAIRWMSRGIVYNVGPQHHQRYQAAATRIRNRIV